MRDWPHPAVWPKLHDVHEDVAKAFRHAVVRGAQKIGPLQIHMLPHLLPLQTARLFGLPLKVTPALLEHCSPLTNLLGGDGHISKLVRNRFGFTAR